jgi:hypothetical protein
MQKITVLFVDGEAKNCGHTRFVLRSLQRWPILVHGVVGVGTVPSLAPKIVGCTTGVSAKVFQQTLSHLAAWVRLAQDVVDAEFPDFRVLSAFSVFSLTPGNIKGLQTSLGLGDEPHGLKERLQRLSQFFQVDPVQLGEDFAQTFPAALSLKQSGAAISNQEAWRRALASAPGMKRQISPWSLWSVRCGKSLPLVTRFLASPRGEYCQQRAFLPCAKSPHFR